MERRIKIFVLHSSFFNFISTFAADFHKIVE